MCGNKPKRKYPTPQASLSQCCQHLRKLRTRKHDRRQYQTGYRCRDGVGVVVYKNTLCLYVVFCHDPSPTILYSVACLLILPPAVSSLCSERIVASLPHRPMELIIITNTAIISCPVNIVSGWHSATGPRSSATAQSLSRQGTYPSQYETPCCLALTQPFTRGSWFLLLLFVVRVLSLSKHVLCVLLGLFLDLLRRSIDFVSPPPKPWQSST